MHLRLVFKINAHSKKLLNVNIFFNVECYKYLSKQKGRFCKNSEEMWNICDGTFKDCVRKGKLKCNQDKSCFGIQAHDGQVFVFNCCL